MPLLILNFVAQEIHGTEFKMGWSHWSSWSACSTTCGKGQMLRSRTCIGPCVFNEHGAHEAKQCNLASCQGIKIVLETKSKQYKKLFIIRNISIFVKLFLAPMEISIKIWKRKYLTLVVDEDQKIKDIKEKIQDKEAIQTKHQSLFFNGKPLENDRTLFDYMIKKDSTLYLYLRGKFIP